jgi:hypothetical protein
VERVTGIEPALSAWEADVLPLNYTRAGGSATAAAYSTGMATPVGRGSADAGILAPLSDLLTAPSSGRPTWLTAFKAAIAAAVAWGLAEQLSGNASAVFAPILAMLTVQASLYGTVAQGIQTIVGNTVGVAVAQVLVNVGGRNVFVVFLGSLAALAVASRLPLAPAGRVQVSFSVLLVLLLGPTARGYGLWRLVDCVIGGAVGIAIALVIPERAQVEPALAAMRDWTAAVRRSLEIVVEDLGAEPREIGWAERHAFVSLVGDSLRHQDDVTAGSVVAAVESVRFNPWARRDRERVAGLADDLGWHRRVSLQARSITLNVDQMYDRPGPVPLLRRDTLADLLQRLADLLGRRLRGGPLLDASSELQEQLSMALTAVTSGQPSVHGVVDSVSLLGRIEQLREEIVGIAGGYGGGPPAGPGR